MGNPVTIVAEETEKGALPVVDQTFSPSVTKQWTRKRSTAAVRNHIIRKNTKRKGQGSTKASGLKAGMSGLLAMEMITGSPVSYLRCDESLSCTGNSQPPQGAGRIEGLAFAPP